MANSTIDLMLEGGAAWQHRNDIEIPPGIGTRYEIDQADQGPFPHYRIEAYLRLNKKHALRAVYAPFNIETKEVTGKTIVFDGQTYNGTDELIVNYKFNSYRLSYLYGFKGFGADQINFGFTGKIRDANTEFRQGNTKSNYDNIGFVPLLYFEYQKSFSSNWHFNLVIDAAAAPQGRAVDAAFKFRRLIGAASAIGFGLRTLEGGADNDKVFAFSWFNYTVLDIVIGF